MDRALDCCIEAVTWLMIVAPLLVSVAALAATLAGVE